MEGDKHPNNLVPKRISGLGTVGKTGSVLHKQTKDKDIKLLPTIVP